MKQKTKEKKETEPHQLEYNLSKLDSKLEEWMNQPNFTTFLLVSSEMVNARIEEIIKKIQKDKKESKAKKVVITMNIPIENAGILISRFNKKGFQTINKLKKEMMKNGSL